MAAYTEIDDPSAFFQAFLYTGTGANRTITLPGNSDLKFDWYWYKKRNAEQHHRMFDTSRGLSLELYPDLTAGDSSATYFNNQQANSFDIIAHDSATNTGDDTFANWQWKCNGGTTATNTTGSIDSVVQANTDAGFSIALATAPGSNGHWSFGHGLGVKPDMVITKQRDGGGWWTWHKDLTNQTTYYLGLNQTDAETNEANMWGGGMTSSVIGVSSPNSTLVNKNYIAYCFASKQGYSKFGKYVGNGNADGAFIYTGFKPAFLLIKGIDEARNWFIYDNTRPGRNVTNLYLLADSNQTEQTGNASGIDFVSNGFKMRNTFLSLNKVNINYIYMAFAENPFTTSTAIPTTAR